MVTLPPAVKHLYDLVVLMEDPQAAWGIVDHFYNNYKVPDANKELWILLGSALTAHHLPKVNNTLERRWLIEFYESLQALVLAVRVLHTHTNGGRLPVCIEKHKVRTHIDNSVQNITDFIVATIQPECIYRLPAIDGCDMLDLVIVMPQDVDESFSHYEKIIDIAGMRNKGFRFSLHHTAHMKQKLLKGNVFFNAVCQAENRVYNDGEVEIPAPPEAILEEIATRAITVFNRCHSRAAAFIKSARLHKEQHNNAMCAFMLHQCIEQCFYGVVLALAGANVRSHSIVTLMKHTQRCAPALNALFPNNTEWESNFLQLLEKVYTESRYEEGFVIAPVELTVLFERAEKVLTVSREACEGMIERLGE